MTDVHNYVRLDVDYLQDGDTWVAQIKGREIRGKKHHNVTLIFYYGVTDASSSLSPPSISKHQRKTVVVVMVCEQ